MEIQSILFRIDAGVSIEIMSNLELLMQLSMAVADPGCLDRGFKFTRGFDLLIVPAYMLGETGAKWYTGQNETARFFKR